MKVQYSGTHFIMNKIIFFRTESWKQQNILEICSNTLFLQRMRNNRVNILKIIKIRKLNEKIFSLEQMLKQQT